jgi:cyclase
MITALRSRVDVPLVASGGAGMASHAVAAYHAGADAVLAASIFHQDKVSVAEVKAELRNAGAVVR